MEIDLAGLVVIVGNYGSGKTEVAVNLAANRKQAGMDVRIGDLDLVNPYFRAREAREPLRAMGIDVVLPPDAYLTADLPILSPLIAGMIRNPGQLALLDVGGDDAGATVLAALADAFRRQEVRMLQVVNPFRPFTETIEGCLRMRSAIEQAARLTIDGLIGNANLMDETTVEDLYDGYEFVCRLSDKTGLPLAFITISRHLLADIDPSRFACPILPIDRQLVPPWRKVNDFAGPSGR